MIEQLNESAERLGRVVVIGANGFVGSSIVKHLAEKNIETLSIGRLEVDLLSEDSTEKLSSILKENDSVVIAAAKAPAKDFSMLLENLRMLRPIISLPIRFPYLISSISVQTLFIVIAWSHWLKSPRRIQYRYTV